MERKQELTSVDLAALVSELRGYLGAKVDKAYRYDEDLLRLRMRHFDHGRLELLLEVGEIKRAHLSDPAHVADAPERPPNFAKMLRNRLSGADWAGIEQHGFDRVVTFTFEREDADTSLVVELFGEGNVVVCDGTGQIVEALRTVRLRSRTVAPGAQYEYPDPEVDPLTVDYDGFVATMEQSDSDLVRTLATRLKLGGRYAEELCTRAGVEKTRQISEASEQDFEQLYASLQSLATAIRERSFEPRVYYADDQRVDVAPIPLEEYRDLEYEEFDHFNDAVDDFYTNYQDAEDESPDRPGFDEEIARNHRIIEQQEEAIAAFEEEAATTRAKAEALYENYDLVDEILTTVRSARQDGSSWAEIQQTFEEAAEAGIERAAAVEAVDGAADRVTVDLGEHEVELDVRTGVERNANRLYNEAKEIEEKKEGAEAAIENTRAELAALEERKANWSPPRPDEEREPTSQTSDVDWVSKSSIPVRRSDEWYERFRWFHTSDEFLVIGGRNADQNEELVRKYLEPGDRFVHAQAHGGPVTILKATGPSEATREVEFPAETLRETAQFAISYSSVWKAGQYAGDAYAVSFDQVSKEPESGEYLEKGAFAIRGDREYYENVPVGVAIGITCEPVTRVIGGPPAPIREQAEIALEVEPGDVAKGDVAKRMYRQFRETFADTSFVRKVASPDRIQEFLPPGQSRIRDE